MARRSEQVSFYSCLIALIVSAALASPAAAEGPRAVVFVTANIGVRDIIGVGLPTYDLLADIGSIGMMNNRTASRVRGESEVPGSPLWIESACATIGAGSRARAGAESRRAHNVEEMVHDGISASDYYRLLTGSSPGDARIVHLGIQSLSWENSDLRYSVVIGGLGDALRRNGLVTAVIGNSDTRQNLHREASLICADSKGLVDMGYVKRPINIADPSGPYGLATNTERLIKEFDTVAGNANLIVVDSGDTSRADAYSLECTDDQAMKMRRWAVERADMLLGQIVERLDLSRDLVIVLSLSPPRATYRTGEVMTPILVAGPGFRHGLLSSASTRRDGIVANTDVTATLIKHFDVPAWEGVVGRPIYSVSSEDSILALQALSHRVSRQASGLRSMRYIAWGLVVFVIAVTLLFALARSPWIRRFVAVTALLPPAVFLAVIWLPGIYVSGAWIALIVVVGLAAGLIALTMMIGRSPGGALVWLSSLLAITIATDLLWGGGLLRESLLSYVPSEGARYYGIGNELMGAFLGSAMIATVVGLGSLRLGTKAFWTACCVLLLLVVVLVGGPNLGANAGGAMAALCGTLAALFALAGRRVRLLEVGVVAFGTAVLAGLMFFFDNLRSAGQSHVGRAAQILVGGDWLEFWSILERKLAMNMMLVANSAWSRAFFFCVCACLVLLLLPDWNARSALKHGAALRIAAIGVTAATAGALLLNDSGVVAAATCVVYLWALLLTSATRKAEDVSSA